MGTSLDPVVADHRAGRAILEGVPAGARAQRAKPVPLVHHPHRLSVGIVLIEGIRNSVAVDVVRLEQDVTRHDFLRIARGHEEAVGRISQRAVANDNVLAPLNEQCSGADGKTATLSRLVSEEMPWLGTA